MTYPKRGNPLLASALSLTLVRALLLVAVPLILLLPLFTNAQQNAEKTNITTTIMVYIVGSDLESEGGAATRDIAEMIKARADPDKIKVLVMTGGTTRWHSPQIPLDQVSVFEIAGNKPQLVHTLPNQSMGRSEPLTAFLDFAVAQYPADKYGLVLWNHGGGPMVGFGVDTRYNDEVLSLTELRNALSNSVFSRNKPLEWIGFDACLMASIEVAALVSDYANFMIASQETLPGDGWNYAFLRDISQTDLSGPEVARCIIKSTMSFYEQLSQRSPNRKDLLTLSCLDLGFMGEVETALNGLFSKMDISLSEGSYPLLAKNRNGVKAFGVFNTTTDFDLIDLVDLTEQVGFFYEDESQALISALGGLIRINETNQPFSFGVSLYYPFNNKEYFQKVWKNEYANFGFASDYTAYMRHFGEELLKKSQVDWGGTRAILPVLDENTQEIYLQLTPEQAANYLKGYYYILAKGEGEHFFLHYMSSNVALDESFRLKAKYNGNALLIRNAQQGITAFPLVYEREAFADVDRVAARVGLYPSADPYSLDMSVGNLLVEIDKVNNSAQISGLIVENDKPWAMHGKQDSSLELWRRMLVVHSGYYLTRDIKGNMLPFSQWEKSQSIMGWELDIDRYLDVYYGKVDDANKELYCYINMVDIHGNNYVSELIQISKANKTNEVVPQETSLPPLGRTSQPSLDFDPGNPKALVLLDQEDLKISLTQVQRLSNTIFDEGDIRLSFRVENTSADYIKLIAQGLVLNKATLSDQSILLDEGFATFEFPPNAISNGNLTVSYEDLAFAGLSELSQIGFTLKVIDVVTYQTRLVNEPISIRLTNGIPVFKTDSKPENQKEIPVKLGINQKDKGIHFKTGRVYFNDYGSLIIEYTLLNESTDLDTFQLVDLSINSTMGFYDDEIGQVRPGNYINGKLEISPGKLEESQINAPGEIELSLLCWRSDLDKNDYQTKTQALTLKLNPQEKRLLLQDRVVYEGGGVRITQLASNPLGGLFLIENLSEYRIRLQRTDDSINAHDASIYITNLLPGKKVFKELTGKDATRLMEIPLVTLQLNVIDEDRVMLLHTSDIFRIN